MKKFKEALCFIVPILLLFVLYGTFWAARLNLTTFAEEWRCFSFLQEQYFAKAVWDTYNITFWPALFAAAVFAVLQYFIKKKIKISAPVYYLGNGIAGSVAALVNMIFTERMIYCKLHHFPDYAPKNVWQPIRVDDILFCLLAGILAVSVLWLIAFVCLYVKKLLARSCRADTMEME